MTGFPNVRFYAGAPIVSPEGYKLGTMCIVDTVPRPEGLTEEQKLTLRDLADMVIKVMVDRRYQLEKQMQQQPPLMENRQPQQEMSTMIPALTPSQPQSLQFLNQPTAPSARGQAAAAAIQEMMTPLSGLQLSLSLLKEDEQLCACMNDQQRTLLNTAVNCSEFLVGLCEQSMTEGGAGSTTSN